MNLRFIDWIWNIRGSLPLAPEQSGDQAFGKLDPLFQKSGTTYERAGDALTFRKENQLAQDKMSVFDGGVLQIEQAAPGLVLRYNLASRALLFCFLAPFLFLSIAQITVYIGKLEKAKSEAAAKTDAGKKEKEKKDKEKNVVVQLNPVDKFLGAPAPEKPKDDKGKDDKGKDGKKKDDEESDGDGPSPTSAYVFAGIFAALYVLGRILEAWLIKRLFQRNLA